jgi:DNA-binding NtrC family response regulator/Tfp pilus assembly protein PilF
MRPRPNTERRARPHASCPDVFEQLSRDVCFYGSVERYLKAVEAARTLFSNPSISAAEQIDIRLALFRFDRIRFVSDTQTLISDLEEIRPSIPTDSVTSVKFRIVSAETVLFREGDLSRAQREFDLLEKAVQAIGSEFLYALVANGLAVACALLGDASRAEEYCQDCVSIFRRMGNEVLYANSLNNFALLRKTTCDYNDAERLYKKALCLYNRHNMTSAQVLALNNIGVVKIKLGEWDSSDHYLRKALGLRTTGEFDGDSNRSSVDFIGKEEINLAHLALLRREFEEAQSLAERFVTQGASEGARKLVALAHEFMGECYIEQLSFDEAGVHLAEAHHIAQQIAPRSDVMTEINRRQAQLYLLQKEPEKAKQEALTCIRLCKKIRDKHEMGAALRIVAEANVELGLREKAVAAFDASINTLKGINECYELMRTCIAYSAYLIEMKNRDADVYLLEAKQLCKKLGIDFFMAQVMLLCSKYDYNNGDFESATTNLKRASEICDGIQACDRKILRPAIRDWYRTLEKAILKTSMESAEKLKSIGKIYEEARFPIEELKPELATEVARNVGAESVFLVRQKNGGYRVALKYNMSDNDAKHILRRQIKCSVDDLFEGKDPKICDMMNGKTLACVPGQTGAGYILCTVLEEGKTFTPRDLEFLFASVEALERVAEEYSNATTIVDVSDFIDEKNGQLLHPGGHFKSIITLDPELIKTIRLAERASQTAVPILLEGETGVGKELFAHAIHANSPRKNNEFIAINAGGVPLNLLESQLFGHVRGAFTDAVADRVGLVEEAKGGTLFFDEVGEMSEELQVKLLRLLENGEFRRLGENSVRYADIRVVSATNKDLHEMVERGLFREDLYYRLTTVGFKIPPLRERKRDVEFLMRHFLAEGLEKIGKTRRLVHVDMKALEAFEIYRWPGNVRELKNEIMRILSLIGEAELIRFGMLSDRIKDAFKTRSDGGVLTKRVERFERRLILKALEENEWNRSKTAEQIGIPRTTLLFKMKQLNIIS